MQIIITGGAGFLGQFLAKALVKSDVVFDEILLVDIIQPPKPANDRKLSCLEMDLSEVGAAAKIISRKTGIIFHLAAVVSAHAEKEFDLGWKINFDMSRQLLEACRQLPLPPRFVFASGLAVYGGYLPSIINEATAVTPQSSYGIQKAAVELLVNDFTRKGFVDGRVLRLPTICIRPGRANRAASSFVSGIIREPINGEKAICPVPGYLALLISSPDTAIQNIIKAATMDGNEFGNWRTINLPAISVTVNQMLASLEKLTNKQTVERIDFKPDETIEKIVRTWPGAMDNTIALQLGFKVDQNIDQVIAQYILYNQQDKKH